MRAIRGARWKADQAIPSERELCERYGVSRTTARRAIADLVHAGLLYTVAGKGTFVAEAPPTNDALQQEVQPLVGFAADLASQGLAVRSVVESLDRIEAEGEVVHDLELAPFAPVVRLSRTRLHGERPLASQTSWLPEHLCPGLSRLDFTERSLFQTLREDYGLRLVSGRTAIRAGLASEREAALLDLQAGAAVLRTVQTTRIADGRVIERCASTFPGDGFVLTVTGGAAPFLEGA